MISYPLAIVNVFVAGGLIHLYLHPFSIHRTPQQWSPPLKATLPVAIFFLLSNIYLVIAPFVPPTNGQNIYDSLPYYLHCIVGIAIFVAGAIYWVVWAQILPRIGGYELVKDIIVEEDGWGRAQFSKRKLT